MRILDLDTSTPLLDPKPAATQTYTPASYIPELVLPAYRLLPLKRLLDIVGALALLILFSPVFLLLAFWIPLDSAGDVLYSQKRKGRHQQPFPIFKFRTMRQDAHRQRRQLFQRNEVDGILFKMRKDPRITRLGRFLRKYSIDELPQLLNVLLGDMSLVGPRPFPLEDFERAQHSGPLYERWLIKRHAVRPGLTGLWQVSGRNNLPFKDLMRLDLYYVEHWNPLMDLHILWKTLSAVMAHRGAY